ncbi:MAG: hypothetical protein JO307_20495 [Bryobacterales bacterium]|nr:hypothetical protein [Bryobacterales bacterium]
METGFLLQVASTFTCTPIEASLRASIVDAGIADGLGFVQYGQMSEYMLGPAPQSAHILGTIVLVRVEDWLRDNLKSSASPVERGELRQELSKRADEFVKQLEVLSGRKKQVWFLACPSVGWIAEHHKIDVVCQTYTNLLATRVRALSNVTVLSWPASLAKSHFPDRSADRLGQIPFTQSAFDELGKSIGNQLMKTLVRTQPTTAPAVAGGIELAAYLADLRVEVRVAPAAGSQRAHIDRLVRTAAAFSLTGEDPNIEDAEIDALVESENCMLFAVSDRISDNGVSGLAAFRPVEDSLVVERLALSCTVLGKQVEYAVLSALAIIAADRHLATVHFKYRASGRNQEMLRFLESIADADPDEGYVVRVSSIEGRIIAAATKPGAWTLRLELNTASLLEATA